MALKDIFFKEEEPKVDEKVLPASQQSIQIETSTFVGQPTVSAQAAFYHENFQKNRHRWTKT
jgi:hypothetical protein